MDQVTELGVLTINVALRISSVVPMMTTVDATVGLDTDSALKFLTPLLCLTVLQLVAANVDQISVSNAPEGVAAPKTGDAAMMNIIVTQTVWRDTEFAGIIACHSV